MHDIRKIDRQVSSSSLDTLDLQSNEDRANSDKDLKQMSSNVYQIYKSLLHATSEWIAEQQQLESNFHRQTYEQRIRTQHHRQPNRLNLPNSSMAIQTRQSLGENITVGQKQPSQTMLVKRVGLPFQKHFHGKITHVKETEQIVKTIEQTGRELDPGMDHTRKIDRQVSSSTRDTFDISSNVNNTNSDKDLKRMSRNVYQIDKTAVKKSSLPEIGNVEMVDLEELEKLETIFDWKGIELETGMTDIWRIDTQVSSTSRHTCDLKSQENSDNSLQEQIPVSPSTTTQEQTRKFTEQQLYQLQHRIQDRPKPRRKLRSFFRKPKQTLSTYIKTRIQKQSSQNTVAEQSRILKERQVENVHTQELERVKKTSDQRKVDLEPVMYDIRKIDEQAISTSHASSSIETGQEHKSCLAQQPTSAPPVEPSDITVEELHQFIKMVKQKRIQFGMTQRQVSWELSKMTGKKITERLIYRFENFYMNTEYMRRLKPLFHRWLQNTDISLRSRGPNLPMISSYNTSESSCLLPKMSNSVMCLTAEESLEKLFLKNPIPAAEEIHMIAESLNVDKATVMTWFQNRRTVQKKTLFPTITCSSIVSTEHASVFSTGCSMGRPASTLISVSHPISSNTSLLPLTRNTPRQKHPEDPRFRQHTRESTSG